MQNSKFSFLPTCPNGIKDLGRAVSYGLRFDEVKNGQWEEHCAADTSVSASDATLQLAIFHLTAPRRGAFAPVKSNP
jgi:hypothetical protein